jgi:hypothetical protein
VSWEWITAFLAALGSILGSGWVIKKVIAHEKDACDARLDAYKEGLEHGEHEGD